METPTNTFTHDVPVGLGLTIVKAKIEKLNAKAEKLGAPKISYTLGAIRFVKKNVGTEEEPDIKTFEVQEITVTGEPIKTPGYTFTGRVDLVEGEPIICTTPGQEIPVQYRTTTGYCDHCKTKRFRNAVYIFRKDEGGYIQVGHSCARDFLGHDVSKVLWYSTAFREIEDEAMGSWGRGVHVESIRQALTYAAAAIRLHGWVSRGASDAYYEKSGKVLTTTSARVSEQMFTVNLKPKDKIHPTPADQEQAEKTLEWVRFELGNENDPSDYIHNLVVITKSDYFNPKRLGLLVSAVGSWQRHMNILAERKSQAESMKASEYVGEIKKRLRNIPVEVIFVKHFDSDFGVRTLLKFKTGDNILIWWTGGVELKQGAKLLLTGTVKKHELYQPEGFEQGVKQTVLSRCVLSDPPTTEPPQKELPI